MTYSAIANQFEDDARHLVWRSEQHRLSSEDIHQGFDRLQCAYSQFVSGGDRVELSESMGHWTVVIDKLAERHREDISPGFNVCPSCFTRAYSS